MRARIIDKDDGYSEYTAQITVENVPPEIWSVTNSGPVAPGKNATITVNAVDAGLMFDTLSYEFDCDNDDTYEIGPQVSNKASCSFGQIGKYQVNVRVGDGDGGYATDSTDVEVINPAPTLTVDSVTVEVDEGETATNTGTVSDPHDDTVDLAASTGTVTDLGDGTWSWSFLTTEGPAESQEITITATNSGGAEGTTTFDLMVNNLPPAVDQVTTDGPIDEGGSATITVSASDPAGANDPLNYEFDCDNDLVYDVGPQSGSTAACSFDDNGYFQVNVRVDDGEDGLATGSTTVEVTNVDPMVLAAGSTVHEDGLATVSGTIDDPGGLDTFTLVIDWGEGDPQEYSYAAGTTSFSEQHQYLDDNPSGTPSDDYDVGLAVTDKDEGEGSSWTTVTVNNLPPDVLIDAITDQVGAAIAAGDVVLAGLPIEVQGSYSDVGSQDTHTARVDWGDGDDDELGDVTGAASASHAYGLAGDYTLTLSVTDDDTGLGQAMEAIRVIAPDDALGSQVAGLRALLEEPGLDPGVAVTVQDAIDKLVGNKRGKGSNGALGMLAKGNLVAAVEKIQQAVQALEAAEAADPEGDLDLSAQKAMLAMTAKSVAVEAISGAEAVADKRNEKREVEAAWGLVAAGDGLLAGGDYVGAVGQYRGAVQAVQGVH